MLLVYGDTNSTLAAALASVKLHIPICHVEAGARTHSLTNPEEVNRVCTDHVSSVLLAYTQSGYDELKKEGLEKKSLLVGDPMYDAFVKYSNYLELKDIKLKLFNGDFISVQDNFYYLTCHREENTKDDNTLLELFKAMESLKYPTIYPVHPRNKNRAIRLKDKFFFKNIILCEPIGYLESISLVNNAIKIVTDSGGLQREAFFAKKKCVTLLNFVSWPETMVGNRNELSSPNSEEIIEKLEHEQVICNSYNPFGDGNASKKMLMK